MGGGAKGWPLAHNIETTIESKKSRRDMERKRAGRLNREEGMQSTLCTRTLALGSRITAKSQQVDSLVDLLNPLYL